MVKHALITGITGQDGSYLAELLLDKGYTVHGIKRRASSFNTARIDHLYQDPHESDPRLVLHYGDLTDSTNLIRIVQQVQPDEIYNLGAQSDVALIYRFAGLRIRSTGIHRQQCRAGHAANPGGGEDPGTHRQDPHLQSQHR